MTKDELMQEKTALEAEDESRLFGYYAEYVCFFARF